MRIPEMQRPDNAKSRTNTARDRADVRETPGAKGADDSSRLHDSAHLRQAVEKLVQSGDLDASSDGRVREGRVELARQKTANGAYADQGILSDIVDRLLEQWEI